MKNKDKEFFKDYIATSNEFKHFEFIQWFINTIVDDVYCDVLNTLTGELEYLSEWALKNYKDYIKYHPIDIWIAYNEHNYTPRKPSKKLTSLILAKYDYKCTICDSTDNLQIDHIFPYSKGGKTVMNNLTVLCSKCNRNKSDKY